MNQTVTELRAMAHRLRDLFPEAQSVQISSHGSEIDVDVHRIGDADAVQMLERLGLEPEVRNGNEVAYIEGEAGGVRFCVYRRQEAVA